MKQLFYFILLVIGITAFYSCTKNITTEVPIDFLVPGSFPANEADAVSATTAAYSRMHAGPNNGNMLINWYYNETPFEICFQGNHNQRSYSWYLRYNANNSELNSVWANNYQGVALANTVISLVPKINMTNKPLQNRLVAEAKFCRAFYFFELVKMYGAVPIVTDIVSDPASLQGITRKSTDSVYLLIKKDLQDAAAVLPATYTAVDNGRATTWAALGLLARVQLATKDWSGTVSSTQKIIDSKLFGLVSDYKRLWSQGAEFTALPGLDGGQVNEFIFEIQFQKDLRPSFKESWTGSRDARLGGAGNYAGGFENMLPTTDYLNMFEAGDLRKDISYLTTYNGYVLKSPLTPGAGPITGKYINPGGDVGNNNSGMNIFFIRYSDVLLMKAEAENEINGPAGAYTFINLVRRRAGITALSGLDQIGFRQAIIKERATELGFEALRKFDLIRWGIFIDRLKNAKDTHLATPAANVKPEYLLAPIPQIEIDISKGSIAQNPGY